MVDTLFGFAFALAGVALLVGAHQKWDWLIDPPTHYWFIYSQSFVKLLVGRSGLIGFTYLLGAIFTTSGLFLVVDAFSRSPPG